MREDSVKHLEIVQKVIDRLAGNSFFLKGWTITVVAALLALAAKDANRTFALVALLPAVSFWGLDAYYLRQERLFRYLYEDVRMSLASPTGGGVEPFSLSVSKYEGRAQTWFRTLWSPTIAGIHAVASVTIVVVLVFLR